MAGWQDAPVVESDDAQPAWMSAPEEPQQPRARPLSREQAIAAIPAGPGAHAGDSNVRKPSAGAKVVGGIEAALSTVSGLVNALPGAFAGFLGGAAGAAETALRGGVQPLENEIPAPGKSRGVLGTLQDMGSALNQSMGQGAQDVTYQPKTETGQQYAEATGEALGPVLGTLGGHGATVVPQVAGGAHAPSVPGAVAGAAVRSTARRAGGAIADALTPNITPEMAEVGRKAQERGIPIMPHELVEGAKTRRAGNIAEGLGFFGNDEAKQNVFDGTLIRMLDPESGATRLTRQVYADAMSKAGKTIGETAKQAGPIGHDVLKPELEQHRAEMIGEYGEAVAKPNLKFIADIEKALSEGGGSITGEKLHKITGEIGDRMRNATDGDTRRTLGELQQIALQAIRDSLPKDAVERFDGARRNYAIGSQIEPVMAKLAGKRVSPALLMQQVTKNAAGRRMMARGVAGDLGELADIGQLLKDPSTSGTAENALILKLLGLGGGAVGSLVSPGVAAGAGLAVGAGSLYNKVGPGLARRMVSKALRGKGEEPPAAPEEFEHLPGAAPEGGGGATPAPPGPLGDLTPEWSTSPGAAERAPVETVPAEGLVRAVGEEPPLPQGVPSRPGAQIPLAENRPLGELTPDWGTSLGAGGIARRGEEPGLVRAVSEEPPSTGSRVDVRSRAGREIPAVPGRPDLPDTMVSGPPAETGATQATGEAMQTREATLARVQQAAAALDREIKALGGIPVGEATELPTSPVKATSVPKHIPVGQATELETTPVKTAPQPKSIPVGEATEMPEPYQGEQIPAGQATEVTASGVEGPQPEIPAGEAKELYVPPEKIQASWDAWRSKHGISAGSQDEARAQAVRKAWEKNPDAVTAAAAKFENNPAAFDAEVQRITGAGNAPETKSTGGGGTGAASTSVRKGNNLPDQPAAGKSGGGKASKPAGSSGEAAAKSGQPGEGSRSAGQPSTTAGPEGGGEGGSAPKTGQAARPARAGAGAGSKPMSRAERLRVMDVRNALAKDPDAVHAASDKYSDDAEGFYREIQRIIESK